MSLAQGNPTWICLVCRQFDWWLTLQYSTWFKESRIWAKCASLGEVVQFGPKLAGLAGDTFLDRSRSSVGVGSSFFDMFQVWGFFFDFSFFVVSGSAEGSRKVPQIWLRSAGGRQIRQNHVLTLLGHFSSLNPPKNIRKNRDYQKSLLYIVE